MTPQRFLNVLRRRSLIVWCVIAVGLALMYSFRNAIPPTFVGVSHVVLVADSDARDPSVSIVDLPSIATSTVVLERVRKSLDLPNSLVALKGNVTASILGRSSIMAIGYRDRSAERAIAVSNAVSDELSRYYDQISTSRYDVNVNRLSSELTSQTKMIHDVEAQMGNVVGQNPYVVSDASIDSLTSSLSTLSAQRAQAFAQLQGDQAIVNSLAPSTALSKTARHEILNGDPAYVAVRRVAAQDDAQLAADQAGYTKDFPGLPGAVAKVRAETAFANDIASKALADPNAYSPSAASSAAERVHGEALVAGDQARVSQLDALIASQQDALRGLPGTGSHYNQLREQRDALQTELQALATRRANALANRAEASSLGSVVVLDRAIKADTQLAGGRSRAAVLAFLLTLACAIGAAFLVDSLDPRIRRAEEVEELYGIPVVARFGAKV